MHFTSNTLIVCTHRRFKNRRISNTQFHSDAYCMAYRTITFINKTSILSVKKNLIMKEKRKTEKKNQKKVLMDIGQLRHWIHEYIIGMMLYYYRRTYRYVYWDPVWDSK